MRRIVPDKGYNVTAWQIIRPGQETSVEQTPATPQALAPIQTVDMEGVIRGYLDDWQTLWQVDDPLKPIFGSSDPLD